ncbi:transposable element tcb2 transposase [Trichonephila clavipes]|nr:transposable element tcb2 transposase [Trichonephila clavipes]
MGPLIRLDTTLTGDRYASILSDHLRPFMSIVHSHGLGGISAVQCVPHVQIATEWLQGHFSEFRHFRCLPKPPDMNIIELIRDALQRGLQKRSPAPLTPTDLWTALQDSWCQLPPPLLQTLIESMPRRVASLLCARGGPIP